MLLSPAAISRQADSLPHGSMFGVRSRLCTFRARRRARGFLNTAAKAQQVGDKPEPPATASQEPARRQAEPRLECIGTAMEVECRIVSEGPEHVPVASPKEEVQAMTEAQQNTPHTGLSSLLDILLLVSPFFFWGTSMVAMKQLAPHTTPLLVASWRLIPAGIVLLAWAAKSGRKTPTQPMAWVAMTLFGLGFLAEGLQRTSAGLGSVIIDSQPLTVALLASLLFGEKLGSAGVAGLFVGVAGLCLLELPPSVITSLPALLHPEVLQLVGSSDGVADAVTAAIASSSSSSSMAAGGLSEATTAAAGSSDWTIWDSGEWWMLLAAQSMAVGTVMVRWVAKYCDPVVATGWHMVLGGIPLLAAAVWREGGEAPSRLALLTGGDLLLLLYISLLGSAASYGVFFYNASRGNLTALSSLTFLTPMFAAAGGYLALGETLTPLQLAGATVTLGAVALINNHSEDAAPEAGGDSGSSSEGQKRQQGAE
ncbi:WAT1-related protein [Chlorella vulgaris]